MKKFIAVLMIELCTVAVFAANPKAELKAFAPIDLVFNVSRFATQLKSISATPFLSCSTLKNEFGGESSTTSNDAELKFKSETLTNGNGQMIVRLALLADSQVEAPNKEKFLDQQACHVFVTVSAVVVDDNGKDLPTYFTSFVGHVASRKAHADMTSKLLSNLAHPFSIDCVYAGTSGPDKVYNLQLTQTKTSRVEDLGQLMGYDTKKSCGSHLNHEAKIK